MIETLLVLAALVAMTAFAVAPPAALLQAGLLLVALGLAVGVPFGLVYHLRLREGLLRAGGVPRGWWLSPTRHHARLDREALARLRPAFLLGAAGFLASLGGCLFVALAGLRLALLPA